MTGKERMQNRPFKESRSLGCFAVDSLKEQRLEAGSEPLMSRDIEPFLLPGENGLRKLVLHQLTKDVFQRASMNFEIMREPRGKFDDAVIQKRRTNFQRVRHTHPVRFIQNVVRQVIVLIHIQKVTPE